MEWEGKGVNVYFKVRGLEGVERSVTLKLYTNSRLSCDCNDEATRERVLRALAEELRPAVERLGLAVGKWPRWHGNALELPAGAG